MGTSMKLDPNGRSDLRIIYEYLTGHKEVVAVTSAGVLRVVKRDDGTDMSFGSVSAALNHLTRRGMLAITEQIPVGPAQLDRKRNVYTIVKYIDPPRFMGARLRDKDAPVALPTKRKVHITSNGSSVSTTKPAHSTGLSQALLDLATRIEQLETNPDITKVADKVLLDEMDRRYQARTERYRKTG